MSKIIKRIISSLLVISAFAAIEPVSHINLITEKASASSFDSSDDALLKSLDTDEGSLSFSSTRSSATGKVKSSVDEVKITAKGKESDYEISIDGETTDSGESEKTVDLDKGKNTIRIKVKDPNNDKTSVTYYVYITRGTSSSDDDDDDDVYLDDITVSGANISFSKNTKTYNVEVADSVDEVRIKAEPDDDDDTVEIDGTEVDDDDSYKKWVTLDKGKNSIEITVEDDDDNERTYTLNVYRGEKAPSTNVAAGENDDNQDSIYLDELELYDSGIDINYRPKVTYYEVNVKEDFDNVIVKSEPEDDDDIVRVNDNKVKDANYNSRVYLQKGKNVIKVKVNNDEDSDDDDYEERTYTIVVNRGTTTDTANNTNTNNGTAANNTNNNSSNTTNSGSIADGDSAVKANQWVKNKNGQWTYNDDLGKPMINTWFFDKSNGKWYRLGLDGSMRTGWQYENGNTYYLNEDGSMQTGWKYMGSGWFYFNPNGTAKTGWFQDNNGKWYYCYPGGVMAYNIKIDGYKLGTDGTMV